MSQLNVKEVIFTESEELNVELDLEMTPELEAEGFARELSRKVQSTRKNMDLKKEDRVSLTIYAPELKDILSSELEFLKERTGSSSLEFSESPINTDEAVAFKIKGKVGSILVKLN